MDYKTHIREVFNRSAAEYGGFGTEYFDVFAARLLERAKPFTGAHILDVATGRGALLKRALKDLGSEGKGYGIDMSPEMIEATRREVREKNALLQCMDAEELEFEDGSFDIVYCGFGLFFFPDLRKAMDEFRRVLKPGGRIAVSTWGDIGKTRLPLKQKLISLGIDPNVAARPMPTPQELQELFEESQFSAIEIVPDKLDHIYLNFDHWWDCLWKHAMRSILEKLTEEQIAAIKEELSSELESFSRPDGFHEDFNVYYTTANS